jgi:hypothetical protein
LIGRPKATTRIQFRDLQKGRTIATTVGRLPKKWHEMSPDDVSALFAFPSPGDDDIGHAHGYMGRKETYGKLKTKQTTLKELKQEEGFKKRKK